MGNRRIWEEEAIATTRGLQLESVEDRPRRRMSTPAVGPFRAACCPCHGTAVLAFLSSCRSRAAGGGG
jgi:hypothetical protein